MAKWNENQKRAIYTENKNILVSASAGSGKTTVLIARLMDLVLNKNVEIDRILAMTFTEAAASEMKKRLAASLQKAYDESDDENKKAYIKKQLSGISNAYISTIHSFCLTTLKKYYYIIGLEPERIHHILDEGSMYVLQEQALRQVFKKQYEKEEISFLRLCEMFSARSEEDDKLEEAILDLAAIANTQKDSKQWLLSLPSFYEQKRSISELPSQLQYYFFESLKVNYIDCVEKCLQLVEMVDPDDEKAYTSNMNKLQKMQEVLNYIEAKDYMMYQRALKVACNQISATSKDADYSKLRDKLHKKENALLAKLYDEHVLLNDLHRLQPIIMKLCEMTLDFMEYYQLQKELQRAIDFDDMEHYTLAILQANDGQIAKVYQEQFVQIMVDEFQDSNKVQNELVQLICRENNVFRVGDIKQSIYGFRYAKPEIMRSLIENKGVNDEVIYLSNNYRSKKSIVDFNNLLFKRLMNLEGFHKGFHDEDYAYVGLDSQKQENHKIKFHALIRNKDNKENKDELKARFMAHQIQECLNYGYELKDICILTRSNKVQLVIKKVLDAYKIPCFVDMKTGFFQSTSVQCVISALKAIDDPNNDIAFVAFLTSPFMNLSFDELARIKALKRQYASILSEESKQKVYELSFYGFIKLHEPQLIYEFEQLRKLRYVLGLSDMMNEIYRFNQYYEAKTNKQERVNLDLLFDKAVEFEKQSALGIHAFIEQIALIKDQKNAEATSIGKDEDVVRIMSIHQSKGLQFPVVLLFSTHGDSSSSDKKLYRYDETLGIALTMIEFPNRYLRTTLMKEAIKQKQTQEDLEEAMRVLYVATTRAEKEMHIVDIEECEYPPLSTSLVYRKKGYTSWMIPLMEDHPSLCEVIRHTDLIEPYVMKQEVSDENMIETYQKNSKIIRLNSATAYKNKKNYTSLKKSDGGMQYGTKMHKMVELLSNQKVDESLIVEIAKQEQLLLSDKDIEKLMNLYHNPLFMQFLKHECYFELPYQARKDYEIYSGYLDFVCDDGQVISIVDFKSDALNQESEFIKRYKQQLDTYAYAMKKSDPNKQVKTYIYAFNLHKMIEVR